MRLGIVSDSHLCPDGTPPGLWHNRLHYDRAEERLERVAMRVDRPGEERAAGQADVARLRRPRRLHGGDAAIVNGGGDSGPPPPLGGQAEIRQEPHGGTVEPARPTAARIMLPTPAGRA